MATISRYPFIRHLRADPNQYILYFRSGRLVRKGPGLSFWFGPLTAAVGQVPVEDCETTFMLRERSADFQEVAVQCTVIYRFADPEKAASRLNFSISLANGTWVEPPLERVANLLSQRAQKPARGYLVAVPVVQALTSGAEAIRGAVEEALRTDEETAAMGLAILSVQIIKVMPSSDVEKALQTPTREQIQQKADEAIFERRALAVEKERAIKQNELSTEIELARKQEELIRQQGANQLHQARGEADAERMRVTAAAERQAITAKAAADEARVTAEGRAEALRLTDAAAAEAEARRIQMLSAAPSQVILGLALREFADKIKTIQHLNISPDLFGETLKQFLRDQSGK